MANAIIMPKTGMAMEEGAIIQWLVEEGATVEKGDPIVEIETDKSTMEVESDYDGVILKILYEEGSTVPVVVPIAFIGEAGEDISALVQTAQAEMTSDKDAPSGTTSSSEGTSSPADEKNPGDASLSAPSNVYISLPEAEAEMVNGRVKATPAARRISGEKSVPLNRATPSGRSGEVRESDVVTLAAQLKSTPLAARIAADQGMDLASIDGSGHGGKVMKGDLASGFTVSADAPVMEDKRVKLTQVQKITGKRMLQSHLEIPVVTENIRPDVTEMMAVRKRLNETLESKITVNDFVLLATVKAIMDNPRINSILDGDELIYKGSINMGMAVATPRGLLVPVIPNAQNLSLGGMAAQARDLSVRGREGQLQSDELSGSTFTISNVGMFGVNSFTPIINQPNAAILGVCAVEDQLKMIDGEVVNRQMMGLSLTYDHRIVDGAEASIFLRDLRDYLEAPLTVLV